MIELYHNDMSTCAKKVRLVLSEKGLAWQSHHMNLRAGDTRKEDYIKNLNPLGVVPTLVDNGAVVYESNVIIEYLDDAYPTPALRPTSPLARARMRLWTKQLDEGVHAATAVVSSCIAFRYQQMEGRTEQELRDFINLIPDAAARERSHDVIFAGVESKLFAPAVQRFLKLLHDMEAALAKSEWLADPSFSLADIAYVPYLTRLEHLQMSGLYTGLPHVVSWYERVKERPSYDEALRKWFNPKYLELMQEKGKKAWPAIESIIHKT